MFNQHEKELHLHGTGKTFLLENRLKEMFGKKYCLLTCSATGALETLCGSLKVTNKIILTSPFQWPGMLVPFITRGNLLQFGSVNQNLNLQLTNETFIPPHIVFAVDYLGIAHSSQESIKEFCDKNGSIYITDASSSMGTTTEKGHPTGLLSDFVITSFGPQKPFYGGEGGAILTDDETSFEKMLLFTGHPYRQLAEGLPANLFIHNFRMNPLGIQHLEEYFDDYLHQLRSKQLVHYNLYQQLFQDDIISDKGPVYLPGISTFSTFVVDIKMQKALPVGVKISRNHMKPVFSEIIPSCLEESALFIVNNQNRFSNQIKNLVSLEIT